MLALGATTADFCYRSDTSTFWDCIGTPSTSIGNWSNRGANGVQGSTFVVADSNTFAWYTGNGAYDFWMTSTTQALPGNAYTNNVRLAAPTLADEDAMLPAWYAAAAAAGISQIGSTLSIW